MFLRSLFLVCVLQWSWTFCNGVVSSNKFDMSTKAFNLKTRGDCYGVTWGNYSIEEGLETDCGEALERWQFNQVTGECEMYTWTGCPSKTRNDFSNELECESVCQGPINGTEICNDCREYRNPRDLYGHPTDCRYFYHCEFTDGGPIAHLRKCCQGQIFNDRICACVPAYPDPFAPEGLSCMDPCMALDNPSFHTQSVDGDTCARYYQCANKVSHAFCCPRQSTFNMDKKRCERDRSCVEACHQPMPELVNPRAECIFEATYDSCVHDIKPNGFLGEPTAFAIIDKTEKMQGQGSLNLISSSDFPDPLVAYPGFKFFDFSRFQNLTICVGFNMRTIPSSGACLVGFSDNGQPFNIRIYPDKITAWMDVQQPGSSPSRCSIIWEFAPANLIDEWHQVCLRKLPGTLALYFDGTMVEDKVSEGFIGNSECPLVAGGCGFDGFIDHLMICDNCSEDFISEYHKDINQLD